MSVAGQWGRHSPPGVLVSNAFRFNGWRQAPMAFVPASAGDPRDIVIDTTLTWDQPLACCHDPAFA